MKAAFRAGLILSVAAFLYIGGYLMSAQKFEAYTGSMPIDDPTWSTTVELNPTYRFFGASFWRPLHLTDRTIRPKYWTYTVRSTGGIRVSIDAAIGKPIFVPVPEVPLFQRLFPTL